MLVGDLPSSQFRKHLTGEGLGIRIGPLELLIVVRVPSILETLHDLYRFYPVIEGERVYNCHVEVREVLQLLPRPKRMVRFIVDGRSPHPDMAVDQALCVLEWGINLVVAMRFHCFLMLHAAVVERNGYAMLLPAAPGAGKTTLCAGLVSRGWRLLSDEFGMLRTGTTDMLPVPRALPLKNESIEIIRAFAPDSWLGPKIHGTRKGTISHLRPLASCVAAADQTASARWLIFPRWQAGAEQQLQSLSRAEAFALLATNAFNYEMAGEAGFNTVRDLVAQSRTMRLEYSDLQTAVAALTVLTDGDGL
jgi:HprK-related kinase A